jgi:hypothetical protein
VLGSGPLGHGLSYSVQGQQDHTGCWCGKRTSCYRSLIKGVATGKSCSWAAFVVKQLPRLAAVPRECSSTPERDILKISHHCKGNSLCSRDSHSSHRTLNQIRKQLEVSRHRPSVTVDIQDISLGNNSGAPFRNTLPGSNCISEKSKQATASSVQHTRTGLTSVSLRMNLV